MKVGTICKLKVDCLGNKAGTLGVVFYDYGNGFQAIFENGNLDGFSRTQLLGEPGSKIPESEHFLEEVGFEQSLAGYQFQNVKTVAEDYRMGKFDLAWSEKWKNAAILNKHKFATEQLAEYLSQDAEYEKCEVYADGNKPPWLRFKRKNLDDYISKEGEGFTVCMLSAAKDYVDFSHFEYEGVEGKFNESRCIHADKTICPLYVVFRKKGE